jgi:hypothetical protein
VAQQHLSRPRAVPTDFVELEHPNVESTFRCAPGAVPHWEARGWKQVSEKSSKSSKKASDGASSGSES